MNYYLSKIRKRVYKLFHPPLGEIVMLHRVVEERSILEANRQMEITPEFLEKTIEGYLKQGRPIVSLDEVYQIIHNRKNVKKPFICFTFDDGYKDNYELAYPIFKKYNCSFAIYVTTNLPDGKALLWWYIVEAILLKNNKLILGDGSEYDCSTIETKNATFDAIRQKVFNIQSKNIEEKLNNLFVNYSYSFKEKNKSLSLSWNQITELANDNLCTIASHTKSHGVLSNMSAEEVVADLRDSKLILENHIKKDVKHFAYPYGACNEFVIEQVKLVGYKTAVLANGGMSRKKDDFIKLKRSSLFEQ